MIGINEFKSLFLAKIINLKLQGHNSGIYTLVLGQTNQDLR